MREPAVDGDDALGAHSGCDGPSGHGLRSERQCRHRGEGKRLRPCGRDESLPERMGAGCAADLQHAVGGMLVRQPAELAHRLPRERAAAVGGRVLLRRRTGAESGVV